MDKLKLDIQMFSNDEEEKIYGFDDNGCKYPVQSEVLNGTEEPTSDIGKDGDIYLQYE